MVGVMMDDVSVDPQADSDMLNPENIVISLVAHSGNARS